MSLKYEKQITLARLLLWKPYMSLQITTSWNEHYIDIYTHTHTHIYIYKMSAATL